MVARSDNTAEETLFRIGGGQPAIAERFRQWKMRTFEWIEVSGSASWILMESNPPLRPNNGRIEASRR